MNDTLVYPHERTLGGITLVLGLVVWFALIVGTFGSALLVLAAGFILYLFAQSTLIAHIRGNGVELSATQFPDLHTQFVTCCAALEIKKPPQAYVLNGNGGLNAFATKFLGEQFVVLFSDVVDAMAQHPDGVRFYIGHELGHLRMKHLSRHLLRWPVLWLPLLGAAYSRARESTCDRHGLACCTSGEGAARALAALSAGAQRWKTLDLDAYRKQTSWSSGFWMSFHELTAGYPWLTKRVVRVQNPKDAMPRRNPLAYLLAVFVPYAGRLGAGFAIVTLVYILGVMAAVALPAYKDYQTKEKLALVVTQSQPVLDALTSYYERTQQIPESLEAAGAQSQLTDGSTVALNAEDMALNIRSAAGELVFTPRLDEQGSLTWSCSNGEGLKPAQLPPSCHP